MQGKITGIVIDQTRAEGKWYVRELRDENGGIKPLFFRREKSDLIGRLVDKFRHVESAQRYAARHMDELGFDSTDSMTDVYAAPGKLKLFANERQKLAGERLQRLLAGKAALASAGHAGGASKNAQVDAEGTPPVTVIHNQAAPKEQLDRLWNACRHRRYDDKQDKNARADFDQRMGPVLQLYNGELATNDPAVWRECRQFIDFLDSAGQSAWAGDAARLEFGQLCKYFLPAFDAGPAASRMNVDDAAVEAGKMGFALERFADAAKSGARTAPGNDPRHSLEHMFQVCFEEHASTPALEAVVLPWPKITTSRDQTELTALLAFAQALPRPSRNDDRALLEKTIAAIGMRLARTERP